MVNFTMSLLMPVEETQPFSSSVTEIDMTLMHELVELNLKANVIMLIIINNKAN